MELIRKILKKLIGIDNLEPDIEQALPGLDWHVSFIEHLAKVVRPKVYVELGLYQCELFNRIIPFAEKLIGVDISEDAGKYMNASAKSKFICASTNEFAKILLKQLLQIDLLFIDADHSKEAVSEDFRNLFPFVSPHGLILLHDTHPGDESLISPQYCGTAYAAITELSQNNSEYELVTIPVSPGLTICRKRTSQLNWKE